MAIYTIFAENKFSMETVKKSRGLYWILFLVSIAVFFGVYAVAGGYCSMILPFNITFLAMALDLM
ncbi:MAG: hypothetical protein WKF35_08995 [Ferruginibacter sp.]